MRYYNPNTKEFIQTTFNHLDLPEDLNNPVIDGVSRTMNLTISKASGWHYVKGSLLFVPAYRKVQGQSLTFDITNSERDGIQFRLSNNRSFTGSIRLIDIMRIVFNISDPNIIRAMIGIESPSLSDRLLTSRYPEYEDLINVVRNSDLPVGVDVTAKLRTILTTQTVQAKPDRLYSLLSLKRFVGTCLAEDVTIGTTFYEKYTIITERIAFDIEHSGRQFVKVITDDDQELNLVILTGMYCALKPGTISDDKIKDFSYTEARKNQFNFEGDYYQKVGVPTTNTLEVYCAVINRMLAFPFINEEISMQEYDNQSIDTIHDQVANFEMQDLEKVYLHLETADNFLEGVSGHKFDTHRVTNMIKKAESAVAVISKNENPFALTAGGRSLVRTAAHLAKEARQVLPQDLGLIDPVDSSESKSIGKNSPLTMTTEILEDGTLVAPLYRVVDGEVTSKIDKVPTIELDDLYIAEANPDLSKPCLAKHKGVTRVYNPELITHARVSPFSTTSFCRAVSSFMENTDPKRTQMTANTIRQARAILRPKRALIETGVESIVARGLSGYKHVYTVRDIFAEAGIDLTEYADAGFQIEQVSELDLVREYRITSVSLIGKREVFTTFKVAIETSAAKSQYYYELVPPTNDQVIYAVDDIVYRQHNIIINDNVEGDFTKLNYHTQGNPDFFNITTAAGLDLFVMVGFYSSFTVDDASVISDRVVRDMSFSTPVVNTYKFQKNTLFDRNKKEHFGFRDMEAIPEGYTSDGLPRPGTYLKPGSVWLYRYVEVKNGNDIDYYNTHMRLDPDSHGEVISVTSDEKEIKVVISKWVHVEVGDKTAARHGNKTIISRVERHENMPFHPETGRHVDLIINPLAIPTRENISQLSEMQASMLVKSKGLDSKVIPPFSNELFEMVKNYEEEKHLTELDLIDPRTGLYFPGKHFCGYMHYFRNYKIAEEQLRSIGDAEETDLAFGQPEGGGQFDQKGQAISSMEKEILVSMGAEGILREIHSVLSSDAEGYREICEVFQNDLEARSVPYEGKTSNASHMVDAFTSLLMHVEQQGDYIEVSYLSDEHMKGMVQLDPNTYIEDLSNRAYVDTTMYIDLNTKFISNIAVEKYNFTNIVAILKYDENKNETKGAFLTAKTVKDIIEGKSFFVVQPPIGFPFERIVVYPATYKEKYLNSMENNFPIKNGMPDLIEYLENNPIEQWIALVENSSSFKKSKFGNFKPQSVKILKEAKRYAELGGFNQFITTKLPVIPGKYRQGKGEMHQDNTITAAYKDIVTIARSLERGQDAHARLYKRVASLIVGQSGNKSKTLFEFWANKESGGRIRGKILKTRIRNSMRGTIVPMFSDDPRKYGYPEWAGHPDTIGLPLLGAIDIAQPRVVGFIKKHYPEIYNSQNNDIELIAHIANIVTLPIRSVMDLTGWTYNVEAQIKKLKKDLINCINGSLVFYGRAPSLHETSMRGGIVYVHEERVIHLHSLLTVDFNADHDGDQMYVAMPITEQSVNEIRDILLPSNNVLRYNDGAPSLKINQDALLGIYFATEDAQEGAEIAYVRDATHARYLVELQLLQLNQPVYGNFKGYKVKTTVGRLILHSTIFSNYDALAYLAPSDEEGIYTPYFNKVVSSETGYSAVAMQKEIFELIEDSKEVTKIYSDVQRFGYFCADLKNITLGIKDLTPALNVQSISEQIEELINYSNELDTIGLLPDDYLSYLDMEARRLIEQQDIFNNFPEDNTFKILAKSGAKGKAAAIEKMFAIKGFAVNGDGKRLPTPILTNLIKGLSQFQVEDLAYNQRTNALSTVMETSKPGETLRSGAFELSGLVIQASDEPTVDEHIVLYDKHFYHKTYIGRNKFDKVEVKTQEDLTGYSQAGQSLTVARLRELSIVARGSHVDIDDGYTLFADKEYQIDFKIGASIDEAIVPENPTDWTYEGLPLYEYYIIELASRPQAKVQLDNGDYLYFDCQVMPLLRKYFSNKMDLSGNRLTEAEIDDMLYELPSHVPIATYINEFSVEKGVTQYHAGFRAGTKGMYKPALNIGIKHSTATGEPANQMVISRRHIDVQEEGSMETGVDMFKAAIQNGRFYSDNIYELLAPEPGTISVITRSDGILVMLNGDSGTSYSHLVPVEKESLYEVRINDGDKVVESQCILTPITGEDVRRVSPIQSYQWDTVKIDGISYEEIVPVFTKDLVQNVRFWYMYYLSSIYDLSGIQLDPAHYAGFALQTVRFCRVVNSDVPEVDIEHVNLVKYFDEPKYDADGVVMSLELTNGFETILLTAGAVAGICYRNPLLMAKMSTAFGPLEEFGNLGKVALGADISKPLGEKKYINEPQESTARLLLDLSSRGEEVEVEIDDSALEAAFEDDDIFGDDIFGEREETKVEEIDVFAVPSDNDIAPEPKESETPINEVDDKDKPVTFDFDDFDEEPLIIPEESEDIDSGYERTNTKVAEISNLSVFGGDEDAET